MLSELVPETERELLFDQNREWDSEMVAYVNPEMLDPTLKPENEQFPVFAFDLSNDVIKDGMIVDHIDKFAKVKLKDGMVYDRAQNETLDDFFDLIIDSELDESEISKNYADYQKFMDYREEQLLGLCIQRIDAERNSIKMEKPVADIENTITKPEDVNDIGNESLLADASNLKTTIETEWNKIILGKRTYDFDHDVQLEIQKQDYYDSDVYDRAWEVKDIIEKLLNAKYLAVSQVVIPENKELGIAKVDYRQVYRDIQEPVNHGKNSCRLLLSLTRLMGNCIHRSITFDEIETLEPEVTVSSGVREVW